MLNSDIKTSYRRCAIFERRYTFCIPIRGWKKRGAINNNCRDQVLLSGFQQISESAQGLARPYACGLSSSTFWGLYANGPTLQLGTRRRFEAYQTVK